MKSLTAALALSIVAVFVYCTVDGNVVVECVEVKM